MNDVRAIEKVINEIKQGTDHIKSKDLFITK